MNNANSVLLPFEKQTQVKGFELQLNDKIIYTSPIAQFISSQKIIMWKY